MIVAVSRDLGRHIIGRRLFSAVEHLREHPVISFSDDEVQLMVKYYDLITFKISHTNIECGSLTIQSLVRCYATDLLAGIDSHAQYPDGVALRQGDKLYRRFIFMLSDEHTRPRSVAAFAEELCVTPKYLTAVCRARSGKTAGAIIADSTIATIKHYLLYSDLTIKEIAVSLGFSNLSFFGKYVKKHLGMSPTEYRRKHTS